MVEKDDGCIEHFRLLVMICPWCCNEFYSFIILPLVACVTRKKINCKGGGGGCDDSRCVRRF